MQEMTVYGVSFDLVGKQPIVLLKPPAAARTCPIWIGHPEAAAILMNLQGTEPPRPLTHDLACAIIDSLDAEVDRVTVTELRDSTFHARITLVRNGTEIEIDSRTSDAIAIALRADAKIFAADDVIEESGVEFEGDEEEPRLRPPAESLADLDPDEFRRFLDTVSPDEFATGPRGRRRTDASSTAAELPLRQREQLVDQALEPFRRERAAVRRGRAPREAAARGPGRARVEPELRLQPPELGDELEAAVDRRDDRRVVRRDLGAGARRTARSRRHRHDQGQPVEHAVHDHRRVDATGLDSAATRGSCRRSRAPAARRRARGRARRRAP